MHVKPKKEVSHLPFRFSIHLNSMEDIVIGGSVVAGLLQFPFGKLVENPSCFGVVHLLQDMDVDYRMFPCLSLLLSNYSSIKDVI